jgi:hypothetical protein
MFNLESGEAFVGNEYHEYTNKGNWGVQECSIYKISNSEKRIICPLEKTEGQQKYPYLSVY